MIARGYTLIFLGRGMMRLGQAMQRWAGKETGPKEKPSVGRRCLNIIIQYIGASTIAWFFLGGRTIAHEHGIVLWLFGIAIGVSIYRGLFWGVAQLRSWRDLLRRGAV